MHGTDINPNATNTSLRCAIGGYYTIGYQPMLECHKFDQNKITPNLTEYTALVIILTDRLNKPRERHKRNRDTFTKYNTFNHGQ